MLGKVERSEMYILFAMTQVLLVDKISGITSHTAVAKIRHLTGVKKIGHCGTLDPAACGLLIMGCGTATRLIRYMSNLDKRYIATITLGTQTTTDDSEGEIIYSAPKPSLDKITLESIGRAAEKLSGTIKQIPSAYSAIKVSGNRAYNLARQGIIPKLNAREVRVHWKFLGDFENNQVHVQITCSSGTYVRALARDMGKFLGVGGHLSYLKRLSIGPFHLHEIYREINKKEATMSERTPNGNTQGLTDNMAISESDKHDCTGSGINCTELGIKDTCTVLREVHYTQGDTLSFTRLTTLQALSRIYKPIEVSQKQADDLSCGRYISLGIDSNGPVCAVCKENLIAVIQPVSAGLWRPETVLSDNRKLNSNAAQDASGST